MLSPDQYKAGLDALEKVKTNVVNLSEDDWKIARDWPSVFTGISVISNRSTPAHRDRGSAFQDYDILCSVGTHRRARLTVHDFGLQFGYAPGTGVALCGKLIQHEVSWWEGGGGERVCYAHFMKRMVLERLQCSIRKWATLDMFI